MARRITRPILKGFNLSELITALTVPGEDGKPRRLPVTIGGFIDHDPVRDSWENNRNNADRIDWFAKVPDETEVRIDSVAKTNQHGTLWFIEGWVIGKKRGQGDSDERSFKGYINTTTLRGSIAIDLPF